MNHLKDLHKELVDMQKVSIKSAWDKARFTEQETNEMKAIIAEYVQPVAEALTKFSLKHFVATSDAHRIYEEELLLKCLEIDAPENIPQRMTDLMIEQLGFDPTEPFPNSVDDAEEEEDEDDIEEDLNDIGKLIDKVLKELRNR